MPELHFTSLSLSLCSEGFSSRSVILCILFLLLVQISHTHKCYLAQHQKWQNETSKAIPSRGVFHSCRPTSHVLFAMQVWLIHCPAQLHQLVHQQSNLALAHTRAYWKINIALSQNWSHCIIHWFVLLTDSASAEKSHVLALVGS